MISSSASSSGEDGDIIEDSWLESDDEFEGGEKSLDACSLSVEATSLNPESCGESFGSVLLGGGFFDCLGVQGADGVAFLGGVRTLDGAAEAFVAERFGLAFNSLCSLHAYSSSPSKYDIIGRTCASAEPRDKEIEITDDDRQEKGTEGGRYLK